MASREQSFQNATDVTTDFATPRFRVHPLLRWVLVNDEVVAIIRAEGYEVVQEHQYTRRIT